MENVVLFFRFLAAGEGINFEYQTPSDELVATQASSLRAWRQRAQGAGVATIVLLLMAAAVHRSSYQVDVSSVEDTEDQISRQFRKSITIAPLLRKTAPCSKIPEELAC